MRPPRSSDGFTLIGSSDGFTLIELMIAVAIVGVLAALAIPSFAHLQSRSRASEGRVNLAAIRTAEKSYFTEFGTYAATSASPPAWGPGSTSRKLPWADAGGFDELGWQPEGAVAFQYQVVAGIETYTAEARSDMDGDGVVNVWGVVQPDENGAGLAGAFGCPATGVYDPTTGGNTMFETVGPCAPGMGQSIF